MRRSGGAPFQQPSTSVDSGRDSIHLRQRALVNRGPLHKQRLLTKTSWCCSGSPAPPLLVTTPNYDFGVRLGHAPQINEDNFIGRDDELEQIQTWPVPRTGRQTGVAICGMGGMGKTQLSIHLVKRSESKHLSVFWLNAKNENTLGAGLATLATEVIEISASSTLTAAQEEERLVLQARQWLSQRAMISG
jgi:hypothetical protein